MPKVSFTSGTVSSGEWTHFQGKELLTFFIFVSFINILKERIYFPSKFFSLRVSHFKMIRTDLTEGVSSIMMIWLSVSVGKKTDCSKGMSLIGM